MSTSACRPERMTLSTLATRVSPRWGQPSWKKPPRLRNGWMMPLGVWVATGMLMRPSMHLSTRMAVG